MIEGSQKMIDEQNNSPPVNEHFKLQSKTPQNAPTDVNKSQIFLRQALPDIYKITWLRTSSIFLFSLCQTCFTALPSFLKTSLDG
jgi:hypothetical protein